MTPMFYRFQVGGIACTVLLDGASAVDAERFMRRFPHGDEADYRRTYAEMGLSFDEADSSMNILAAQIGDELVLFDTGQGGDLLPSMAAAGLQPEAVTLVVLTHTHGDHVMGLLDSAGAAAFPNARYVISKPELDFWQGRIDAGGSDQGAMLSMMHEKGLRTIAMDEAILPGLTAVPIPGHTPGQIALLLESEGERLIHMADLLHSPMQFAHPEWSAYFDVDTAVSVPTRRAALGRAADEGLLALFYHLTFPGVGRVGRGDSGFTWSPLG